MNTLALWDSFDQKILSYPRADDEPVVNLDPRYLVLRIVKEAQPDAPEGFAVRQRLTVDLDALEWRHGWELIELPAPAPPTPDYVGFYAALLDSATYQTVLQVTATAELARALAVFVSTIQDAMAGRVKTETMQDAIWLLLGQVALTDDNLTELAALMATYHLDSVYTLQP